MFLTLTHEASIYHDIWAFQELTDSLKRIWNISLKVLLVQYQLQGTDEGAETL